MSSTKNSQPISAEEWANNPDIVQRSTLNVDAKEFVPDVKPLNQIENYSEIQATDDDDVSFFTMACLQELSLHPGEFDDIVVNFMDEFLQFLECEESTQKLAVTLAEYCVSEGNSRYIGVKLADLLKKLSPKSFLRHLLNHCETIFTSIFENPQHLWTQRDVAGFAFFVGELYVQFKTGVHNRYRILAHMVIEILEKLITSTHDDHIMVLLKLLKLVGQSLAEDKSENLVKIIKNLECLLESGRVDTRTVHLLNVIISAHNEQWQLNEVSKSTRPDKNEIETDPVLYGPDGEVISSEENSFLTSCLGLNEQPAAGF